MSHKSSETKALAQQQYSQVHKEVVEQDKRKYTEELDKQAQEAATQHEGSL